MSCFDNEDFFLFERSTSSEGRVPRSRADIWKNCRLSLKRGICSNDAYYILRRFSEFILTFLDFRSFHESFSKIYYTSAYLIIVLFRKLQSTCNSFECIYIVNKKISLKRYP